MKTYQERKNEIREQAIDIILNVFHFSNLSYGEILAYQTYFEKVGKRYGLLREFKENGIL